MTIGAIGGSYGSYYSNYNNYNASIYGQAAGTTAITGADTQSSDAVEKQKKAAGLEECETCENRKYQDGSDEMVSYKAATNIAPESVASAVQAHEQEHVSNAYKKAAQNNGEVVQASVTIKTAICPECGRSYVSGGETNTQIKYYNEDNPYQQDLKTQDADKYTGMNVNLAC